MHHSNKLININTYMTSCEYEEYYVQKLYDDNICAEYKNRIEQKLYDHNIIIVNIETFELLNSKQTNAEQHNCSIILECGFLFQKNFNGKFDNNAN